MFRTQARQDEGLADGSRLSYADERLQVGKLAVADAGDLPQLRHGSEAAVCGAPVDDALGEHRSDARELVELIGRRSVEVDRVDRTGRPAGPRGGGRCGARDAHQNLLAIDQLARQV